MQRVRIQIVGRSELNDIAEVHNGDTVADVLDDVEVMRNEKERQSELLLQVVQQMCIRDRRSAVWPWAFIPQRPASSTMPAKS